MRFANVVALTIFVLVGFCVLVLSASTPPLTAIRRALVLQVVGNVP